LDQGSIAQRKCRSAGNQHVKLYLNGQTRVHIDRVQDLGDFLVLEVVLRPEQNESEGKTITEALLSSFGIDKQQLVGEAYVDLLARRIG
jgi:adenylate cyclase class IV